MDSIELVMIRVWKSSYPGWNRHPVYTCGRSEHWHAVTQWMYSNDCDHFLLSSGSTGYTFQVRKNIEWFELKWL